MSSPADAPPTHDLVLVGGGHAHVQVLRRWAMEPVAGVRLTVVVDTPVAVYSGMVPGYVAGQYTADDLEIDVRPLAKRARARFVVAPAVAVDPAERCIRIAGRPPVRYDTASFDVGSTVAGLAVPGVREHALATRPIGLFVRNLEQVVARARSAERARIVVVGAGAGGVEVAFALRQRLVREGIADGSVVLLEAGPRALPGYPAGVVRRVERQAHKRGVEVRLNAAVRKVDADAIELANGETLPCDAVVWVAGAAAIDVFHGSGLPTDEAGFVRVGPTLQVEGHAELFAVGDCAHLVDSPWVPKAGVYAVREGPYLTENLKARLEHRTLRPYRPQRDFLSLLNLGDGRAIGSKWGVAFQGGWVFRWKDRIDRRFMRRFQVLSAAGNPRRRFPEMPGMSADEMPCGGCAAKVGETVLTRALARVGTSPRSDVVMGLDTPDDAAAVETPGGEVVVSSVDAFRAFTDDPWLVGRVAAANAASDLWAKGVAPRFALAQVGVPEDEDDARAEETLYQVLAGARTLFDAESIALVGGHTTSESELSVGFALFGFAPDAEGLLRIGGLEPGDALILTKPLGTGVLFHADMRGQAAGRWMEAAGASMQRANSVAARVAVDARASAATDVSGFGLAGHLGEMLRASKASARLNLDAIPLLPGARELLARGLRSSFHPETSRVRRALRVEAGVAERPELDALFDPQTSGGLLFGVSRPDADSVVERLRAEGDAGACIIGEVTPPRPDGALFEVGSD